MCEPAALQVCVGDVVLVCPETENTPLYIGRVVHMWEEREGRRNFHAHWFTRSAETVLGEAGDATELFLADLCDDNPLGAIMDKVNVGRGMFSLGVGAPSLSPLPPPPLSLWLSAEVTRPHSGGDTSSCRELGHAGRGGGGRGHCSEGGGWG